jgi:hypothetical protein
MAHEVFGVRPAGGGGGLLCSVGRRRKEVEWAMSVKRPDGPAGCCADWAEIWRKFFFGIKIGFLNIPRPWKFVQGDLGGILMWKFFLNSSRLFKDFRKNKMCHAMRCILCKIIFGWFFICTVNWYATYMHFYTGKIIFS